MRVPASSNDAAGLQLGKLMQCAKKQDGQLAQVTKFKLPDAQNM